MALKKCGFGTNCLWAHLDEEALDDIRVAASRGQPLGSERFRQQIEAALGKRLGAKKRGRPQQDTNSAVLPGQMSLEIWERERMRTHKEFDPGTLGVQLAKPDPFSNDRRTGPEL